MTRPVTFQHLRVARAADLRQYLRNTRLWQTIGNEAFARRIAGAGAALSREETRRSERERSFVLYHAWKPGYVELTRRQADLVRLIVERRPRVRIPRDAAERALAALGWCAVSEPHVPSLVRRAQDRFVAIQNVRELTTFLRVVKRLEPRVVVEIGTARGGMLYCLSQIASTNALLVSVDLPGASNAGGQTSAERRVYRTFSRPGQRMIFVPKDSHLASTRRAVERALAGRRIDLLFLDGDHSKAGIAADYANYSTMVCSGGVVAFHDISGDESSWGGDFGVPSFWRQVKKEGRVTEIVDPTGVRTRHLLAGQHHAWGIGLLWRQARRAARR